MNDAILKTLDFSCESARSSAEISPFLHFVKSSGIDSQCADASTGALKAVRSRVLETTIDHSWSKRQANYQDRSEHGKLKDTIDCMKDRDAIHELGTTVFDDAGVKIQLTKEQQKIMDAVHNGENVFINGLSRVGKSTVLKALLSTMDESSTFITTGDLESAVEYGSISFREFTGIAFAPLLREKLVEMIKTTKNYQYWISCKVLLIDGISSIEADLLDTADYMSRALRNSKLPFGGIQVIVCGDFLNCSFHEGHDHFRFAFEAACWKKLSFRYFELKLPMFQDRTLAKILPLIRIGQYSSEVKEELTKCVERFSQKNNNTEFPVLPTKFYIKKDNVDQMNKEWLASLRGSAYHIVCEGTGDKHFLEVLDRYQVMHKDLVLKVGAQVVLTVSLDPKKFLFSGCRGVVVGWESTDEGIWPRVMFLNNVIKTIRRHTWTIKVRGVVQASCTQIPLRLAWVLSLKTCQRMKLDTVEMNLSSIQDYGSVYTALSKLKNLESLKLDKFHPKSIRASPRALSYYNLKAPIQTAVVQKWSSEEHPSSSNTLLKWVFSNQDTKT